MDPRQPPQHPFSRNTASPYGRTPFPPTTSQAPFPPASHAPQAPSYNDRQRRPSDPPYYNAPRQYGQDGPQAGPSHSRHQSNSSVGHATPVNRHMGPPPSSPQPQAPQSYGPPPPRAPAVSVGPPTTFPSSRELPSLGTNSRMSISDLLSGGSNSTVSRAPQHQSPVTTAGPSPMYSSTHASPRLNQSRPEYPSFTRPERPRTPEHPHPFGTRDHRSNSAGSPPRMGHYTPDAAPRYHTPQQHQYSQRVPPPDDRRAPLPPQRPNSQPTGYNMPPREVDRQPIHGAGVFGRRADPSPRPPEARPELSYSSRPPHFDERQNPYLEAEREREREREFRERELRDQRERERQREREIMIQRENELLQREREQRDRAAQEEHMRREYAAQLAQRNAAQSRVPEQREQPAWMRNGYDVPRHEIPRPPPYEPIPERERPSPQKISNGYEYPATSAPHYSGPPAQSNEPRYGHIPTSAPQHNPPQTHYEALAQQDMQRQAQERQRLQQHGYGGAPPDGSYSAHESPARRPMEESQPMQQQRSFLGIQELNRRGRNSPLPQAVQGPQPQLNGPGSEPSIKNEFSRMFSGIGSGVGQVPSPTPQYAPTSQGLRREDLQTLQDLNSFHGSQPSQPKRRRVKDEDRGDDESSTGRNTPGGRGKRGRAHNHHAGHHHHQSHHHRARNDPMESTSSPSLTPFKSARGAPLPSPPQDLSAQGSGTHHHHVPRPHNHHVTPSKPEQQKNIVVPIPKSTIRSKSVIDSVANMPRKHLGHAYYESTLRPVGSSVRRDFSSTRGFASTPQPLPRFDGKDNCTFTIKVPKIYLEHTSLSEITSRKALWGVDIYTDDSDVIAACIHQGWFLGAWLEDVENDTLLQVFDMKQDGDGNAILPPPLPINKTIITPCENGAPPPEGCDAHITILILPVLETYGSKVRYGIRSREWGTKRDGFRSKHDGMSYKIESIRFVPANAAGEEAASGTKRKSIMNQQLSQREHEAEESWGDLLMNGNGNVKSRYGGVAESFERGTGPARAGDVQGIGRSSWWKKPAPAPIPVAAPPVEKAEEKEVQQEPVTEPAQAPIINHPQPLPAPEVEPLDDLELAEHISAKSKSKSPMPRPIQPVVADETSADRGSVVDSMVSEGGKDEVGRKWGQQPDEKGKLGVVPPVVDERERELQIAAIMQRMVWNANQGRDFVEGARGGIVGFGAKKDDTGTETGSDGKEVEEDPDTTLDADATL